MSIFARKSPALDEEKTSLVAMEGNAFITRAMAESAAELENRRRFQEYAASYVDPYTSAEYNTMASGGIVSRSIAEFLHEREGLRERVQVLPVPSKAVPEPSAQGPDEEYLALANKLGIRSAAVLTAQLETVLAEEMIPVYEYAKVKQYLDNECRKAEAQYPGDRIYWAWFPVRECDRLSSEFTKSTYQKAIPREALLTMAKVAERLPEAKFFVSQIQRMPDPFLAVTVEGADKWWVLERWDEPGFRS